MEVNYREFPAEGLVIGIDPGALGGIASMEFSAVFPLAVKMPKGRAELHSFLREITEGKKNVIAFIEEAQTRPTDTKSSVFFARFNKQYESCLTALEIAEIPYCKVHPMTWQSRLKLLKKRAKGEPKEEKGDRKKRLKAAAQNWNPHLKVTNMTADALLIHKFGMYALRHEPEWIEQKVITPQISNKW